jgi:DNA-binding transcriptional MerR regulator
MTTGEIAIKYGVPVHRVLYLIRARGIEPVSRAGNSYVYDGADVERIGAELRRMRQLLTV